MSREMLVVKTSGKPPRILISADFVDADVDFTTLMLQ